MIGAAVLAAGASTRLGTPKQLLRVNGRSFVRHTTECALGAAPRVAVVVGHASTAIVQSLVGLETESLENLDWSEGIASSIRVAVKWAESSKFDALLLLVSDQPYLQVSHLRCLSSRYAESGRAVASGYAQTVGVPALFPACYFPALLALRGDRGAASLLRDATIREVVEWPLGALDVDTEASAAAFR